MYFRKACAIVSLQSCRRYTGEAGIIARTLRRVIQNSATDTSLSSL